VKHLAEITGDVIPHLVDIKVEELQHWICAFVLEVRKKIEINLFPTLLITYVLEL